MNPERITILPVAGEFEKFEHETVVSSTLFRLLPPCPVCNPVGYCTCAPCVARSVCACEHQCTYRAVVASVRGRPVVDKPADCHYVIRLYAGRAAREEVEGMLATATPDHTLVLQATTLDEDADPLRDLLRSVNPAELIMRTRFPAFRAPCPIESYTGQLLTTLRRSTSVRADRPAELNAHVGRRRRRQPV